MSESTTITVDYLYGEEPGHPSAGWYVSFEENPQEDDDFTGPFESQAAAEEYAHSIIEAAAVAAVKSMFK